MEDEQRVKIFKALSDPTRLQIIKLLHNKNEEMNCGVIGDNFQLSKPNNSYHLTSLYEAGLVKVRKEGQLKYMKLNEETFQTYLPGFLGTL